MKFPQEDVTEVEMHLWRMAITQAVAARLAQNRLGTFNEEGHKIWGWTILEDAGQLYRRNGDTVEVVQHVQHDDTVHFVRVGPGKREGTMQLSRNRGLGSGRCAWLPLFPFGLFCRQRFWMFYGDGDTPGFRMK